MFKNITQVLFASHGKRNGNGSIPPRSGTGRYRRAYRLLENNADTPTSLYEAARFSGVDLAGRSDQRRETAAGGGDQFNSAGRKLIERFC
ncbi:glutathionylspermidine synthase family protein [Salmonella enterica subsp. enterica]|nr:glutathionylspermidine synthase family protein [Salmonella enterica subsp. enterica]